MKKIFKITTICIVLIGIVVFVIVFRKHNDRYMKAIKYALNNTGDYFDVSYTKDEDSKTITYWVEYEYVDFSKVAIQLEEYIYKLKSLETDEYIRFCVNFVGKLDLTEFSFCNYETDGSVKERFDVAVLGTYGKGYRFYGYYDDSIYSYFTRLEIGKGYDVQKIEYNICFFHNINVVACYAEDNMQFSEIKDFVNNIYPDCKVINIWESIN